jgi:hypothetical protein
MANALFAKGKQNLLKGVFGDLTDVDVLKAVLIDHETDTPVLATDEFLAAIAIGARVATSSFLTGVTIVDGVLKSANITFSAVSGATVESLVIYKDTGDPATSPLLYFEDTLSLGSFPITPNGGNILITPNAAGIFTL